MKHKKYVSHNRCPQRAQVRLQSRDQAAAAVTWPGQPADHVQPSAKVKCMPRQFFNRTKFCRRRRLLHGAPKVHLKSVTVSSALSGCNGWTDVGKKCAEFGARNGHGFFYVRTKMYVKRMPRYNITNFLKTESVDTPLQPVVCDTHRFSYLRIFFD